MKNQINFNNMSEEAKKQLAQFKESARKLAEEDLRYKSAIKPLKAELEKVLADREEAIANGMSTDEAITKFSRVEADRKIKVEETLHKSNSEPLAKAMRETYAFIPENMYEAYKKKIDEHKRGDFLTAIAEFLQNLGIDGCKQGQISKLAENMSDMFGARYAQSKKIVENDTLHTAVSKAQFNKLFMAVFCDMYVK